MLENLIIFGGKGGVGKSSISSSTAVFLANNIPNKNTLLVSFDIAHNLSDLFNKKIGNDVTQISENLFAIEPDPDPNEYSKNYTGELTRKTRELFKSSKLISLIPDLESIIEESVKGENIPLSMKNSLFFQSILDAENPMAGIGEKKLKYKNLSQNDQTPMEDRKIIPKFDIIVADFPPTGNMLALFEAPADSSKRLMKLTLKIVSSIQDSFNKLKSLTKWAKPAAWMAGKIIKDERADEDKIDQTAQKNLAQDILDILFDMELRNQRISALMKCIGSLRLVSIAEKPSYEETKRARELSEPFIPVDAIHINRLIPESEKGKTSYLDNILKSQIKYLNAIKKKFSDIKIWQSKMLDQEPIGIKGLKNLSDEIYGDTPVWDVLNPLHRTIKNPEKILKENPLNIDDIKQKWEDS